MKNTKLSRASQRRLHKKVRELKMILSQNEARFLNVWKNQVNADGDMHRSNRILAQALAAKASDKERAMIGALSSFHLRHA